MSGLDITASEGHAVTRKGRRSRLKSGQSHLNGRLFWALLVVVALSPLPFGSARPFLSAAWAVYVGLAGAIYLLAMSRAGEALRRSWSELGLPALLFIVFCGFLVVQIIPFGWIAGPVPVFAVDGWTATVPQISISPGMTILMLLRQLTYGLFFFLCLQVLANDARRSLMLKVVLGVVIAYALLGMINLQAGDTLMGFPKWAYFNVATGPFVNRNSFATFLALGAVMALGLAASQLVRRAERHRHDGVPPNVMSNFFLFMIAYGGLLVVIVATQSRMGLVACLAGSAVVVILTAHALRSLGPLLYGLPVALLGFIGIFLLYGQGLFERLESVDAAREVRGDLYAQVLELIAMRPLTGFGGGSFATAFPLVHAPPVNPDYVWEKAHSTYLSLWSETGIVFGSLPIIAVALVAIRLLANLVQNKGSWSAQAIALGAITVVAVHSTVDFSLEISAVTFLFVALLAAGVSARASSQKR
ncbi:O-antigen ligase family protein [Devosia chinhatensis]|uniref:O-antigen ligase-related domain-containing protein n=1 Tax=Devosia chinhatensis TaxID=429727 RepID=A0A0F5FNP2_9HYPH|nr:O-antigen ligase family protein [Devosia chinhatensis]KKB09807.1 hypothetical protein VE26_08130 [Devosia chinhatensis]